MNLAGHFTNPKTIVKDKEVKIAKLASDLFCIKNLVQRLYNGRKRKSLLTPRLILTISNFL